MSVCDGRPDDAARYVGERMSDVETAAFEEHLVGCRACQASVKLSTALTRNLARHRLKPASRFHSSSRRAAIIGTLALAAGLMLMVTRNGAGANPYEELGRVASPPPYGGVGVRRAETNGDSIFASAMAEYRNGNYPAAADALRAARAAGVDSAVTTFFIGVSELFGGDSEVAERELTSASGMTDGLYAEEARYYLAKSLLRSAKPELALLHLRVAAGTISLTSAAARALADSVEEIRKR